MRALHEPTTRPRQRTWLDYIIREIEAPKPRQDVIHTMLVKLRAGLGYTKRQPGRGNAQVRT